jgi:hypothetical protein
MSWEIGKTTCGRCEVEQQEVWIRCDGCKTSVHVVDRLPRLFGEMVKVPDSWQSLYENPWGSADDVFHLCPGCRLTKRILAVSEGDQDVGC